MQFEYEMTRDDYKRHLKEGYFRSSIFYLIFFSIFYLVISFDLMRYNFWLVLTSYLLYLVIMVIVLYFVNKIFVYAILKINDKYTKNSYGRFICEADEVKIVEQIDDKEYLLNWNDVRKVKQTKKYIMLFPKKDFYVLFFRKDCFEEEQQYDELVEFIKNNLPEKNKSVEEELIS